MNIMEESAGSAFSIAGFTVFLTRVSKSHLSNTYLPSGVLTFISFVGFLIPVDMIPGRMSLLVTIFLMLVNISQMANHRGPVVSKIKWWIASDTTQLRISISDKRLDCIGFVVPHVYLLCSHGPVRVCHIARDQISETEQRTREQERRQVWQDGGEKMFHDWPPCLESVYRAPWSCSGHLLFCRMQLWGQKLLS